MFATIGYSQVSLTEIAREGGLTAPGLRHHFPTKQHLLMAIIERRFDRTLDRANLRPPDQDGTGPFRIMLTITEMIAADPDLTQLFVLVMAESADARSQTHDLFVSRQEVIIADLVAQFQEAVTAGHLREDVDYRALARQCIAVTDGLQLQWILSGRTLDFVSMNARILELLAADVRVDGRRIDLRTPAAAAAE